MLSSDEYKAYDRYGHRLREGNRIVKASRQGSSAYLIEGVIISFRKGRYHPSEDRVLVDTGSSRNSAFGVNEGSNPNIVIVS
jgi:hypothetical protein